MPSRLAHHRSHRLFGIGIVLLLSSLVAGCGLLTSEKAIDRPEDRFSEATAQQRAKQSAGVGLHQGKAACVPLGGMTFVRIEPGTFQMGADPGAEKSESTRGEFPAHAVTISQPFLMSCYEVTVQDFRRFVTATRYVTEVERSGTGANSLNLQTGDIQQRPSTTWRTPGFAQTDHHPVVCVSWRDAVAYCEWLSQETGHTCRLPTEAEWEYVARGQQQSQYGYGDDPYCLQGCANIRDAEFRNLQAQAAAVAPWSDGFSRTAPVGSFRPNAWGVYDLHGNVGEWCRDWYAADYYQHAAQTDPTGPPGPTANAWRAVRGGSWFNAAFSCRCSGRHDGIETAPSTTNGFRVVVEVSSGKAIAQQTR